MEEDGMLIKIEELDSRTKLRESKLVEIGNRRKHIDEQVQELKEKIRLGEERLREINAEILKCERLIKERSGVLQGPAKRSGKGSCFTLVSCIVFFMSFAFVLFVLIKY